MEDFLDLYLARIIKIIFLFLNVQDLTIPIIFNQNKMI